MQEDKLQEVEIEFEKEFEKWLKTISHTISHNTDNKKAISDKIEYFNELVKKIKGRYKNDCLNTNKIKYLAALHREEQVLGRLQKLITTFEDITIEGVKRAIDNDFFTKEDLGKIYSILTTKLLDKNGRFLKKPQERLEIDELKLLARFQRSFVRECDKMFGGLKCAKINHMFKFMYHQGKNNESSNIGRTIEGTKYVTTPLFVATMIGGILVLTGVASIVGVAISTTAGAIALGVYCYKLFSRFNMQNGWFGNQKKVVENLFSHTEEAGGKIKMDIFSLENSVGSGAYLKTSNSIQNILDGERNKLGDNNIGLKAEISDISLTNKNLQNKKNTMGLYKPHNELEKAYKQYSLNA